MAKHTEGKWEVRDEQEIIVRNSDVRLIARFHAGHRDERLANVNLAAAAPDLLAAAEAALSVLAYDTVGRTDAIGKLEAAIAAAKGEGA